MNFIKKLFQSIGSPGTRPEKIIIFGNGHLPNKQFVSLLYSEWLNKRKATLGNDIDQDIAIELIDGMFFSDRTMFTEYTKIWVKQSLPDYFSDELLLLDQQTGKDLILYALWPPDVAPRIKSLLGK